MSQPPEAPRILIAEESTINRHLLYVLLVAMGYPADEVADGHRAVAACRHTTYDLIFMDCRMAGLDGLTAAQTIRREAAAQGRTRYLPIIGLTAFGPPSYCARCMQQGMDDCLVKPVLKSRLAALLQRWL